MLYKVMFGLFFLGLSEMGSAGLFFEANRFSMRLEYQLIDDCIGETKKFRKNRAITICVCALKKTMENGWGPDYDNDKDFSDNQKEFMSDFRKNRMACQEQSK